MLTAVGIGDRFESEGMFHDRMGMGGPGVRTSLDSDLQAEAESLVAVAPVAPVAPRDRLW